MKRDIHGTPQQILAQLEPAPAQQRVLGRARPGLKRDGSMNKTEAAYASHLELQRRAGTIARYDFQPSKLRLADNTFYTPDFRVVMADGVIWMVDCKGRKGQGYYCEEDAKVKIKVAAEQHPYRFAIVWPAGGGSWGREEF